MHRQESASPGATPPNPPIPFTGTGAPEKWSAMERRMGHPLMQSLRGVRNGTLRLYLPDGTEIFYLGADPGAHANMRFDSWDTLDRIAVEGNIALGEEYARGHWHTTDLRKLLRFVVENNAFDVETPAPLSRLARFARKNLFSATRMHPDYALTGDFYALWLDSTMTTSGALFHGDNGVPLEEAQRAKHRRILGRLAPQKGEHILDLGCGWGGFMEQTARLGVRVTGVTSSTAQAAFATERLGGFGELASVRLEDYRRISGKYDSIVSLGLFETLGETAWAGYMQGLFRNLKPGGSAVVQTDIMREDLFEAYRAKTDFTREHILPGSLTPSRQRFEQAARRAGLQIDDVYLFGRDHAITCDKWLERFDAAAHSVSERGYSEAFIRKWRFHLASRAAQFESRQIDTMQVELSRPRT